VMTNLEKRSNSRVECFSKTLFVLSRCRIAEDDSFEDLLSRSQMHIDKRDEVAMTMQQRRRQKPRCVGVSLLQVQ
jgi:hypothetical protein